MPSKLIRSGGYKPVASDLKGLYHHTFETASGLVIECHLEYEPEERVTYDHPGCATNIELVWALVEGVDIAEVLSDDVVQTIEEGALKAMAESEKDDKADAAEARWEDARCSL